MRFGEKKAGQLNQRLLDKKPGADALLNEVETQIPDVIPDLHLESAQSQLNFDEVEPTTSLKAIMPIIEGTVMSMAEDIKAWRARRRKLKSDQLNTPEASTLNLRPHYEGHYWELTLTLDSNNPTESRGKVAHFTPTL